MSTNNPSLVVQRLDRATDIASSSGLPYKCLVFPVTGGVQAIDAAGTVLPLVGATGSLIPSADNVDDLGTLALRWHDGFFGGTVYAPSITAAASGSSDLLLHSTGTGALKTSSPIVITQALTASGAPVALTLTGSPNTGITAATEAIDINFNLGRSVTWAAGAGPLAAQRAISITAPTYVGNAGTPLTITAAATLFINDAPTQGANMTLTNRYAILVLAGDVSFGGNVTTGGNLSFDSASPTITATAANQGITLTPNGSGAVSLQGSGAANIVAVDTTGGVSRLGFYNAGPVARAAAVSARNAAGVGYVQADAATWVTAINEIVTALQNIGITL